MGNWSNSQTVSAHINQVMYMFVSSDLMRKFWQ